MTMTFRPVVAGTTDVSVIIRIVDSTDGTPETGVVFNTSGIDIRYRRDGATDTAITEVTLTALNDAHSDGGFLHIGNGYYRVDLPDAACASGVNGVLVHGTVTGMVVIGCYVPLVSVNPYDAVRMGMTALPNAAAAASGGLFTRGTGAGQINQSANGQIDVNVAALAPAALPYFAVLASGTLSGTHSSTTADLGGSAPSTDISGMTLYIPSRGFVRIVDSYNTGTGVATFETTSATLTDADPWYLFASPSASAANPIPADMKRANGVNIIGDGSGGDKFRGDP